MALNDDLKNVKSAQLMGGLYILYENGQIYCPPRVVKCRGGFRTLKEKFLKHKTDSNGYMYVTLCESPTFSENHRIHRLLMINFRYQEGCEDLVVNHKDGVKSNNCFTNLEWCTRRENALHALATGLRSLNYDYKTFQEAVVILRENGWSNAKIGRAFGKTSETIGTFVKTMDLKSKKGRYGGKLS